MNTAKATAAVAAGKIKLLSLDVDGTLTDGGIYFGNDGEIMKRFSVFDGQGLRLLMDYGVKVVWITARSSSIVEKRAADLKIHKLVQGCHTKLAALDEIRQSLSLSWEECGHFGDDWPDFPVLKQVGLAGTTPLSPQPMQAQANWINTLPTGNGAVRELCDLILANKPDFTNPWVSK